MPISSNPAPSRSGFAAARALAAAAAILGVSPGCSDDGFGQRHPVAGTVTYKDRPVKFGTINFLATSPDCRSAVGNIVDGAYSMTTFTPGDGVQPGVYKVSIISIETDLSKAQAVANANSAAIDDFAVAKAVRKSKNLIPKKYSSPDTSNLTKEVKAETNKFDFELTD